MQPSLLVSILVCWKKTRLLVAVFSQKNLGDGECKYWMSMTIRGEGMQIPSLDLVICTNVWLSYHLTQCHPHMCHDIVPTNMNVEYTTHVRNTTFLHTCLLTLATQSRLDPQHTHAIQIMATATANTSLALASMPNVNHSYPKGKAVPRPKRKRVQSSMSLVRVADLLDRFWIQKPHSNASRMQWKQQQYTMLNAKW